MYLVLSGAKSLVCPRGCPSTVTKNLAFLSWIFVSVIHDGASVLTDIVAGWMTLPSHLTAMSVQPWKLRFWHGGGGATVGQSGTTVVVVVSV